MQIAVRPERIEGLSYVYEEGQGFDKLGSNGIGVGS